MPSIKWDEAMEDRVVVFLMKQGVISDQVIKTDEMKIAASDVASENNLLQSFIDETYTKCDVINKIENRCDYKEFRYLYADYLRGRNKKPDTNSDTKLSKKISKLNLEVKKSNNIKYILGLRILGDNDEVNNEPYDGTTKMNDTVCPDDMNELITVIGDYIQDKKIKEKNEEYLPIMEAMYKAIKYLHTSTLKNNK